MRLAGLESTCVDAVFLSAIMFLIFGLLPSFSSEKMSSRRWLKFHGLAALKLRIVDVLARTFIPQLPKYVPILNRNVLSKVFNEVRKKHLILNLRQNSELWNELYVFHLLYQHG